MKIKYLSHAAFSLTDGRDIVLIDPFLSGNPNAPARAEDIKAHFIVITHAHGDHLGDAVEIAKANDATVISTAEIANYCMGKRIKAHAMHIGGAHNFQFGRVKLTIAHHGSSIPGPDGPVSLGFPCGALVTIGGKTVYHSGDTGVFLDMRLIGDLNVIDIALLPIGDNYTMGVDDAVVAAGFLNPALSIPMHYNTFDVINADPAVFVSKVEELGKKARVLSFGEEIEIV